MRFFPHVLLSLASVSLWPHAGMAQSVPQLQRNGAATQLMVDGQPFLAIGGELHNSSASSPAYMAPVWDRLAHNGVDTVIATASWELVEPREGQFDFTAVDDQIRQARAHGMHLVLIWFGGFKNADSSYAPSWVRRDTARFPRVARDPAIKPHGIVAYLGFNPTVSVFSDALQKADAAAFAALMRHLRMVDTDHRVVMVQVENEVGMLGDSRDRSAPALRAWDQPVPSALTAALRAHRATLHPDLRTAWEGQGMRMQGTWTQVFGTGAIADEIFMAWHFGAYVERMARAGAAEYRLPMYTNAWLGRTPGATAPGDYPSGGPVAHMLDVWKAAAPTLGLLAPDIYVDDLGAVLDSYHRPDNPVFMPEAKEDPGNLFLALGLYKAIGFSVFGIEDLAENSHYLEAARALRGMAPQITQSQASDAITGFRVQGNARVTRNLGGYTLTVTQPVSTLGAMGAGTGSDNRQAQAGYGLAIADGDHAFIVTGSGIAIQFTTPDAKVEIDSVQEGAFVKGAWVPGRTFNGDERYALFPADRITTLRLTLQNHKP